jgi:hypothetical protein
VLSAAREAQREVRVEVETAHRAWTGSGPAAPTESDDSEGDAAETSEEPEAHEEDAAATEDESVEAEDEPEAAADASDDTDAGPEGAEEDAEDDFSELQGVGDKTASQIKDAGLTTFEDLADSTEEEIREILEDLPPFADVSSWIEQSQDRV